MGSPRSLYIAFESFPRPKGSSSHIASMLRALCRSHAPAWLLCCGHGDMPAWQREGDIEIFRHKAYHPNMLRRAEDFADFVSHKVEQAGPSVRVCVFRDPWGGLPAVLGAGAARTIFEVNALPSWELGYTYPGVRGRYALLEKVRDRERLCLRHCDRILTVSGVTREALVRLGVHAGRVVCLPNAASETFFSAPAAPCDLPELERGRWFGYVGSLHPWQGIETAVDAFALVADELPDVGMLAIVHARKLPLKQLRKRIRKRGLAERVTIRHPLPPERLAPAAARLSFQVAPLAETARNTLQGCCPIKIVESMAAGTPVLASDLRVARELVRHEHDGLLLAPGDCRAWALAIRRMFREPGLRDRLAAAAVATARRRFDQQAVHRELDAVFKNREYMGSEYMGSALKSSIYEKAPPPVAAVPVVN